MADFYSRFCSLYLAFLSSNLPSLPSPDHTCSDSEILGGQFIETKAAKPHGYCNDRFPVLDEEDFDA